MQMAGMASLEVPSRIRHRGHEHDLTLVPNTPPWTVHCDACSHPLSGFHYHCTSCPSGCWFNLHLCCASMPLTLYLPNWHPYPHHSFSLFFSPRYVIGNFLCKLCGSSGSPWFYRCNTCVNFALHLGCAVHARERPPPQHHMPIVSHRPQPPHHMPIQHWGPGTGSSRMRFSTLGSMMVTALIQASVGQLLGIGLTAFPLQDVGSSFFSGFGQLFQSVPSAGDLFTSF